MGRVRLCRYGEWSAGLVNVRAAIMERHPGARTLGDMLDTLRRESGDDIETLDQECSAQVGSLRALRQATGKVQADIAAALRIKQPSVSKIENQADMYLSTLRSYVEAIGGELDLIVRLPARPAIRLHRLGGVRHTEPGATPSETTRPNPLKPARSRT
jgi:hypothetical protein